MNSKIVDLCCGTGGFSLGAHKAGFTTAVAIDVDKDLTSNWKKNFPHSKLLHADIGTLDKPFWEKTLDNLSVDGVIGGPPCQGFSRIGKRNSADPRNSLVVAFAKQVLLLSPKFFVMENVEGLLDKRNSDILNEALGVLTKKYTIIGPTLLNAADFGVPTSRKRAIIVGYQPGLMSAINPVDFAPLQTKRTSVSDAISDLSSPYEGINVDENGFVWSSYLEASPISEYARKMRRLPEKDEKLGWEYAKEKLQKGYLSGFNHTKHTQAVKERFKTVKQGQVDNVSRFPRLAWDKQAPTLRAGTGKANGSFQSMRPIHPTEPRVITIREAARIQGFPDWFTFHPTIWHSFRMIGNSVSPLFSEALMKVISHKLDIKKEYAEEA